MSMETIFYAGDSTAAVNKIDSYPQTGMAQALFLYTKETVVIKSFAKNGRSTKSFLEEGLLSQIEREIKPGDFLLIQFGHNDEKDDPERYTNPATTFQENLRYFIGSARAQGAYPVLVTPIARRHFDGGVFVPGSHGAYPNAMKQVGKQEQVPVIDLTLITETYLELVGDLPSKAYFMWPGDDTHLKPEGAVIMAGFLCRELIKLGAPYDDLFVSKG